MREFELGDDVKRVPIPRILPLIGAILLLLTLTTTWFFVKSYENSVVQRFGEYVRTEEPGLRFKLPWPIETATEVPVGKVQRLEVGFRTIDAEDEEYEHIPAEDEMLTGDENIAHIDFVVQYRQADARKWLFNAQDPEKALRLLGQSSMRLVVAGSTFDEVATTGRGRRQDEAKRLLQQLVNNPAIDLGAVIEAVQLQDVHPPDEVMGAFKDVTNAKEDQQRFIREAEGYKNERVPQARGKAKEITEAALGYKTQRVNIAKGDADRFSEILAKYEQAPELVRQRLRFETIEATLPGKSQVIDMSGGNLLKLLDVNRSLTLPQQPAPPKEGN